MSIGVVETTAPVANDIILGEFKAYANYGLPTETLLGATRGGCKFDIDRAIKEIVSDGFYGHQLNGSGNPSVRYETLNVMLTLEQLYLKYFNRKIIADCESDSSWESESWTTGDGGTYTADTTYVLEGDQSAKATIGTDGYGIHEVLASTPALINLTQFDNSETSTTSDYIGFGLYIATQDLTDLSTADIRIAFHCDAEGTTTNYFYYDVSASDLTADMWTAFKVAKSDFTSQGSPDWSTIYGISVIINGSPGDTVDFYIDSVSLIQNQSKSSILPVNSTGVSYTDEGDYREFTLSLEIAATDYLENVTLVGQRYDGKMVKIILENCINDGKIELALQEKDEVVQSTQFTGHYKTSSVTTTPFKIREYTS